MDNACWERAKEKHACYQRRSPEKTEFYRLVYHGRDRLPLVWEERFRQAYGVLRTEVLETFDAFLDCGILAHGAARAACSNQSCRHSILIAYSCKKRGLCPSCAAKRAPVFAERLHHEILPSVPQRHVIFTLPKRLRPFFKYDRRLNSILFKAAWESLEEMMQAALPEGLPGAVLTIQSAGESLNHNPHVHGICSDGVFGSGGTFYQLGALDTEKTLPPVHAQSARRS